MSLFFLLIFFFRQLLPVSNTIVDQYTAKNTSDAILVINDNAGCYCVSNGVLRQIVFQDYANKYDNNYSAFLSDLLSGDIVLAGYPHFKIRKRLKKMPLSEIINHYLQKEQTGILTFKRKITKQRMITIMKTMFDNGYYVLYDDYRGDFCFSPEYSSIEMRE